MLKEKGYYLQADGTKITDNGPNASDNKKKATEKPSVAMS
jgi:hypothetical protein